MWMQVSKEPFFFTDKEEFSQSSDGLLKTEMQRRTFAVNWTNFDGKSYR